MFREMRRIKQALSTEECDVILSRGTAGVLAVAGDDDYPYAVPLSYVYKEGKIFFHCAKAGHKLDAIARNEKVSFCVIDEDNVIPEEYTTYFRSVIAFGRIRVLEDVQEKQDAMSKLAVRFSPDKKVTENQEAIDNAWERLCVLELVVDYMSGKEAIELAKRKSL